MVPGAIWAASRVAAVSVVAGVLEELASVDRIRIDWTTEP